MQQKTVSMQFRRAILRGVWMPQVFLQDNQVQQGKVGYHVLGVIQLNAGGYVLVNRGWLPMLADRNQLPIIPAPGKGEERAEVYVNKDILAESSVFAEVGWPKRIQRIHLPALSQELKLPLHPFLMRLEQDSPSALLAEWPVINMVPEKHVAYAIQWFVMSAALVIFYGFLGLRDARFSKSTKESG
jgi:surfeit locus 1 family protein